MFFWVFLFERAYEGYKDEKNRKKLKDNIKKELESSFTLLGVKSNLLPTIMWNSAISTGDIKLMSFEERTVVSSTYFDIENYNYEVKRARDIAIIADIRNPDNIMRRRTEAQEYWLNLSSDLSRNQKMLREKINKLLKEPLWS